MSEFRRFLLAATLLLVAAFVIGSTNIGVAYADDDDENQAVSGQFFTQQFGGPTCASPIGVCSSGTVTGKLKGTVSVAILTAGNGVDAQGNPLFIYTASINISTKKGNLSGTIAGQVVVTTGQLTSVVQINRGTGDYDEASGTLNVTGLFNFATGAEVDSYNGVLQTDG